MPTKNSVNDKKSDVKQTQSKWKRICRPKNWREEIKGVKQPCWCREEWTENHEDGNHEPVLVQVATTPVLDKHTAASGEGDEQARADTRDASQSEDTEEEATDTEEESEEELEEGWQHGWYGPVRCEE